MEFNKVVLAFCILIYSCKDVSRHSPKSPGNSDTETLPFIGKKYFETRPGFSGTGTPHRAIEILKNGDVYFSFGQENQGDKSITEERVYAGKFAKPLRCTFKKLDNDTTYYEASGNRIFETDAEGKRMKKSECCPPDVSDTLTKCSCESELTDDVY